MTQQSILEAAKQSNPQAIAALLNRNLQSKGITVKVAAKPGGVLQILLEAAQAPDADELATFIQQGMVKLQPDGVRSLVIFGRSAGNDMPDWKQVVDLTVADATPSPVPEPKPPAESVQPPVPVKPASKKSMPLATKLLVAGAIAFWPAVILLGSLPDGSQKTATITQAPAPVAPPPAPSPVARTSERTPEENLATIDRSSNISTYARVLDTLESKCQEDRTKIADMAVVSARMVNIRATTLTMLEALETATESRSEAVQCSEYLSLIVILVNSQK